MDREVYSQQEIGDYLGSNYHAIKFNPEQIQEVEAFGKTFAFDDGLEVNSFLYYATRNQFKGYPYCCNFISRRRVAMVPHGLSKQRRTALSSKTP